MVAVLAVAGLAARVGTSPFGGIPDPGRLVTAMPAVNDHPLVIGQGGDNTFFFNGGIDEVIVWSRALTAQEVQDIHEATD